jgi:predicted NACHT family NTPase
MGKRKELRRLSGHQHAVNALAFSAKGAMLASSSIDGVMILWDTATGKKIHQLRAHKRYASTVAFSPDGQIFASGGEDGLIILWDVVKGIERARWVAHTREVKSIAFSPDGKVLASASWDSTIRLWEIPSRKQLRLLYRPRDESVLQRAEALAFSPDRKLLASVAAYDPTVRLWSTNTWQEFRQLRGEKYASYAVAFSADGKTVASGGSDGVVRLWEAVTGQERNAFAGHRRPVVSLSFSPGGKYRWWVSSVAKCQIPWAFVQVAPQNPRENRGWQRC